MSPEFPLDYYLAVSLFSNRSTSHMERTPGREFIIPGRFFISSAIFSFYPLSSVGCQLGLVGFKFPFGLVGFKFPFVYRSSSPEFFPPSFSSRVANILHFGVVMVS